MSTTIPDTTDSRGDFKYRRVARIALPKRVINALQWLYLANPPTYRCGLGQGHRKRSRPGKHRALYALCHCWKCARCAPWLETIWIEHLTETVMESSHDLYQVGCSKATWPSLLRDVNRKLQVDGGAVRIDLTSSEEPDAPQLVITTAPVGEPVSKEDAVQLVRAAIGAQRARKRPVWTSDNWEMHRVAKTGEWERVVSSIEIEPDPLRELLVAWGVTPTYQSTLETGAEVVEFEVPSELMDDPEQYAAFVMALRLGLKPSDL